ncbi:ParA family protein [Caenimonas soli]|uniref:ParA family protein n=1 Tax=Caenimonas soli TaxID=2735555 RepID=UPI001557B1B5|nr:ParA family protein [Caenimonas soli]NPC56270.1 ParA family protein [Caenimonas soli]
MPVIAVVNRKGGSGKSTFAAHVAAWCARQGHSVMLGDVDRQQSSRAWLKRRDAALPTIAAWGIDQKNMLRVPTGISHVVLDTPGGIHGFELARVVMFADAIVMPVCPSMFDRESAAACHAELMTLPRAASGRCRLAVVGMRVDGRTNAAQTLSDWAQGLGVPYLGALRETQLYVRSLERGLTMFDLAPSQAAADLAQWEPIIDWLRPVLQPLPGASTREPISTQGSAQESLLHGSRFAVLSGARALNPEHYIPVRTLPQAPVTEGPEIPRFLKA